MPLQTMQQNMLWACEVKHLVAFAEELCKSCIPVVNIQFSF